MLIIFPHPLSQPPSLIALTEHGSDSKGSPHAAFHG
jgi:hypothetical protein